MSEIRQLWDPSLLLQYKTKIKIRQTSKICSSKKLMRYLEQKPYRVYCSKLTICIINTKHTFRKKKLYNVDETQFQCHNLESPSSSRVSLNQSDSQYQCGEIGAAPPPPRPHPGRGGFVYHNLADLLLSSLSSLFPWRRLRTKLGRAAWNMA